MARTGGAAAGWAALCSGKYGLQTLVLAGGVMLYAITSYVIFIISPSLVRDIGGESYYAWIATLFVTASLIATVLTPKLLRCFGSRGAYTLAASIFALGSFGCGFAPSMPVFLLARLVEGVGCGFMLALSYAMVQFLFPTPLWSRVLSIISGMWGVSTLLGPAIGGSFAEYGLWRASLWLVGSLALLLALLALFALPAKEKEAKPAPSLPFVQLLLLPALMLVVSIGSVMEGTAAKIAGLGLGVALLVIVGMVETTAPQRLLPKGAFSPTKRLFSLYLLMVTPTIAFSGAEVYLPPLLQELHGLSPLPAGYLATCLSISWTCGLLLSAGAQKQHLPAILTVSPLIALFGMGLLVLLLPLGSGEKTFSLLCPLGLALPCIGIGMGIAWPHLLTLVLQWAEREESDLAGTSLTSIQLFSAAFGAAFAGTIANMAGLDAAAGDMGATAEAARWLFASLFAVLLVTLFFSLRIARLVAQETAPCLQNFIKE